MPPPLARPAPGATDPLSPLLDLPGVTDALAAAREAVDRLLNHRVLRRQSAAVSSESALRGARASAALEGSTVSLAPLRAGEIHDPVVLGALRVSSGLGALVPVWERAPLQAIARLHVLAAAGAVPDQHLGRPAATADGNRLVALARLVSGSRITPGILLAAVVHGELVAVAPFGSVDGVVARAAARLTMITRGVDPKSVSVPEVGHLERAGDYRLPCSPYSTGEPAGVADVAAALATAVQLGAPGRSGDLRGGPARLTHWGAGTLQPPARERRPVDEAPPRTDGLGYQACTPSRRPPTMVGPVVPPAAGRAWVPGVRARKSELTEGIPAGEPGSVTSFVRPISERRKTAGPPMSRLAADVRCARAPVRPTSDGRRTRPARLPRPRRPLPCPPSAGEASAGWPAWPASTPAG